VSQQNREEAKNNVWSLRSLFTLKSVAKCDQQIEHARRISEEVAVVYLNT
jgi:hypothetical protein